MRFLLPILLVLPGAAMASDVDHALSQAKHFVKKGWYADAIAELQQAIETETGKSSFELHAMLAQIHYQQADAANVLQIGRRALEVSTDPALAAETRRLVQFIEENFGQLELQSPYPGMEASLEMEATTPLLDPEVQRFYKALQVRLKAKVALPTTVVAPVGRYTVNQAETEVRANKKSQLALSMGALGASGLSALQVSRIEFSTGTSMVAGERTTNLRPALDLQFSISQPIGAWIIGTQFDYSVRSFSVEGEGLVTEPLAYTVGARLGREFMLGGPLAFRPSLGYRYGYLPGVEMACESSDPLDPFAGPYTCRKPGDADGIPDLRVYAIARTHIPFAELALDYRRSGRTTAVGLGIKVIGEAVLGKVLQRDDATIEATGESISYTTQATDFSGASVRMLANFSFAF